MGIYELFLGKGIILPVKMFVRKYLEEVNIALANDEDEDEYSLLQLIAKQKFGEDIEISSLGHDALESRHGNMSVFGDTDNAKSFF